MEATEETIKRIPLTELKIDPSYQRSDFINKKVVSSIAKEFDPLLVGVITVGKRVDGSCWVVDGQHRVLGAIKRGVDSLACIVFESRGSEHEAEVFYELNSRRTGINCISIYKALLAQGEETTVHIHQLLDKYGFAIGKKTGEFAAANAIRDTFKAGVLDRVLHVIRESFSGDCKSWKWMFGSSHFIQMLTLIYRRHGEDIDDERMSLVLARLGYTDYQKLASRFAGTTGNRAPRIAPEFIESIYNRKLVKNRIHWER